MYFISIVKVKIEKLCVMRRKCRRKLKPKTVLVTILVLIYLFFPSLISLVLDISVEKSTVFNKSLQTTIPIKFLPDIAPDFQLTELKFFLVKDSIFFIKTTETGDLSSRQACSIESAARSNPDRNISVIYIEPVPRKLKFVNLAIHLTNEYNNIKFYQAPVSLFLTNTPLEHKDEDAWSTTKEEALKYLSFYNFGGTFLELDMIVTESFSGLPRDWVVKESNESLAIGAMSVTHANRHGRLLAVTAVTSLWENFCPKNWTHKIVRVITRVMKKFCSTQDVNKMNVATCHGVKVLEPQSFYPITFWPHLFHPGEISDEPYAYHFWDDFSKVAHVSRKSLFDKLATKFCPHVYFYFLRSIF